jgi:protein-S-isoprenylcysteine O-methyltransferase Ste14
MTNELSVPMATRRLDWGRIVVVPLLAAMLLLNASRTPTALRRALDKGVVAAAVECLTLLLICAFYALLVLAYLRRGPARATSRSRAAHAAAVLATPLPFALPLLGTEPASGMRSAASALLIIAGLSVSVWAVRTLDRSLSIIAQARAVVSSGPYAWVRHPLYVGEVLAALGIVVHTGTLAAAAAWVLLVVLQAFRAVKEEQVLAEALPDYAAYRARTARLLPGVF